MCLLLSIVIKADSHMRLQLLISKKHMGEQDRSSVLQQEHTAVRCSGLLWSCCRECNQGGLCYVQRSEQLGA